MSSDATLIADAARKRAAWAEIEPIFAELRDAMSAKLFGSSLEHERLREKLYLGVQTLDAVRRAVLNVIESGESAEIMREHTAVIENALAETGLNRP